MIGATHALGAVTAALAVGAPPGGVFLSLFGGLLPDIDIPESTLGRYVPALAQRIKHRTVTHSLLFALLFLPLSQWLSFGILVHIVMDMMTSKGVRLFWPVDKRIRLPLARYNVTNSLFEKILRAALLVLAIYLCVKNTGFGVAFVKQTAHAASLTLQKIKEGLL